MRRSLVLAGTKTPPPRRRRRRWRWKKRSTTRGNRTDRKGRQEPRRLDRRYNMKGPTNQETTKAGGGREAAGSTAAASRWCDTEKRPTEKRWYGSTEGPGAVSFRQLYNHRVPMNEKSKWQEERSGTRSTTTTTAATTGKTYMNWGL